MNLTVNLHYINKSCAGATSYEVKEKASQGAVFLRTLFRLLH